MRRIPALLLLAALVGGLGASWAHQAEHAQSWAQAQHAHDDAHHGTSGDHAQVPCAGGDLHTLDCAVCGGLSGALLSAYPGIAPEAVADRQRAVEAAVADARRALSPARGPPAVA